MDVITQQRAVLVDIEHELLTAEPALPTRVARRVCEARALLRAAEDKLTTALRLSTAGGMRPTAAIANPATDRRWTSMLFQPIGDNRFRVCYMRDAAGFECWGFWTGSFYAAGTDTSVVDEPLPFRPQFFLEGSMQPQALPVAADRAA